MGVGMMRRERDGAPQRDHAFVEVAAMMQRGAEIGPGVGIVGLKLDRAAIGDDRFVEPLERVQRIAEIAVRFGKVGLRRNGLALRACGLLVILQLVQRDAEIGERHRHVGLDLKRAPGLFGGEFGPAGKPQHLAEIGVIERNLRCECDRTLHVLDGVGEFAVLVDDDAEEMGGLGRVRLSLQDLAADRLGFHQSALAAAAVGINKRLAERHEVAVTVVLSHCFVHRRLDSMGNRRRP